MDVNAMETYKVEIDNEKTIRWYQNGKRHRTDGPAVECADGAKHWYLNDKCHRTDGPAVEHANGTKHWYLKGELHCVDGPAIERANGDKFWYLNGKQLSEAEFNQQTNVPTCAGKVVMIDGKKYTLTEIT